VSLLFAGAFGSAHLRATLAERGPSCILRMTTGIECPFCGMTRATLALGEGDLHRALALHPLAPLVLLGSLALLGVVALGKTRALLVGRRSLYLLATVAVIWIVRLAV
jgi:hypothetical protein